MNSENCQELFRHLLYGIGPATRFTQDSPVLPDVWMAYAQAPDRQQDLILTPYQPDIGATREVAGDQKDAVQLAGSPGQLAQYLRQQLERNEARATGYRRTAGKGAGVARNQTSVAVRLYFDELVRVALPLSVWWSHRIRADDPAAGAGPSDQDQISVRRLADPVVREMVARWLAQRKGADGQDASIVPPDIFWAIRVIGSIAWIAGAGRSASHKELRHQLVEIWQDCGDSAGSSSDEQQAVDSDRLDFCRHVVRYVAELYENWVDPIGESDSTVTCIHLVSLNRPAKLTIWRSRVAVKADAVKRLFDTATNRLTWAIIDDGIDARHPAFQIRGSTEGSNPASAGGAGASRVRATYNFARIRFLLSGEQEDLERLPSVVRQRIDANPGRLDDLRESLLSGREIDWTAMLPLLEVPHDEKYPRPDGEHGTHVAGILAADWSGTDSDSGGDSVVGICPDLNLLDLRVIDAAGGDEFSVMAALQFVRFLNAQSHLMRVHGVNISLAIKHDVVNYACGRTPVCLECERLVGDGIVVVAAAGNDGYIAPRGGESDFGYRTVSVVDPGNAEGIITVGSTHRSEPHSYGVSYFSSRGPTGDGRLKPDLVAPGEKIESCVPGQLRPKRMDGTSMAAPHVSGAAALLMARHSELIGQPRRIKEILCRTATDLGREPYFQGHGMLDILRALQSV